MTNFGQNLISERQFADKLHASKICSESNYQRLIAAIENKQIINGIDFINYCDKAIFIDLDKYPEKPEDYLEKIHCDVSNLLPDIKFTDFKFKVVLYDEMDKGDAKFYNFVVSIKSNGKTIKQKSFYQLYSVNKNQYYGHKMDQNKFYKLFNKILTDNLSPYPIHVIKLYNENNWLPNQFGVIALTNDQAKMFHEGGVLFSPSYESFKNTLTTKRIEKAVSEYNEIGIFSHLSKEEVENSLENCSHKENKNLNDVLQCFPRVIFYFDTELGNLENPYEEILKELSKISHGKFNPEKIVDTFSKPVNDSALISFAVNEKVYSGKLEVQDDWIDPSIFDLIKQSVTENNLSGQFYDLFTGGQEASVIFLTINQEKYLRENNLIIFADQWQEQEDE